MVGIDNTAPLAGLGESVESSEAARHIDATRLTALKQVVSSGDFEVLLQACLEDAVRRCDLITSDEELPGEPRDRLSFLQAHAHDLKSSSGQIGATILHALALDLEHLCISALQENTYDLQAIEFLQLRIGEELRLIRDLLRRTYGIGCDVNSTSCE